MVSYSQGRALTGSEYWLVEKFGDKICVVKIVVMSNKLYINLKGGIPARASCI